MTAEGATQRVPLGARLASNTLVQAGGAVLSSAIAFFTFVTATRGLGPAAFGDYTASLALILVLVVLTDFGLGPTVVREISESPERTETLMRTSIGIRVVIAAAVGLTLATSAMIAPFGSRLGTAILIGSVGAVAQLLTMALLPVLQAQLKMHWSVVATVVGRLVTLGLTLAALRFDAGFVGIVWANVAGIVATLGVTTVVVSRIVSIRPSVDHRAWLALGHDSLALALAFGLAQVYSRLDTLLLALLSSDTDVGLYGAAYKFIDLSSIAMAAVGMTVLPALSHFLASGDGRLSELVHTTFEVMIAIALPMAVLLVIFASDILVLTSGVEYGPAAPALRILAAYVPLMFVANIAWIILIAARRETTLVGLAIGLIVLNLLLNLVLIPLFGVTGAAVAAVSSEAIGMVAAGIAIRRRLRLGPRYRYLRVLVPAVAAMSAVALVLPAPWLLAAALSAVVYTGLVIAAPGAVREAAGRIYRMSKPAIAGS